MTPQRRICSLFPNSLSRPLAWIRFAVAVVLLPVPLSMHSKPQASPQCVLASSILSKLRDEFTTDNRSWIKEERRIEHLSVLRVAERTFVRRKGDGYMRVY